VNVALNDDGESAVKLTMTFPNVETNFNLTIKGRVENFNASSNAGPVECEVNPGLISFVNCNLSLTQERRTLYVDYETSDFVKISDKYLFDGDFNINRDVNQLTITVTLPEGTVPSGEGESLFPENATANYDISGRKLTISWSLQNLEPNQVPRFQILYEKPIQASILQYLWYFIIAGIIIAVVTAFFVIRHLRRPEKLVLSVLDDFERKVMNVIVASGGTINQKKVVQETNLSKAKVSRVVKSLANRGLIETERLGRTNKLKLVKKKLGI
jgi:uncharacterized membrane protein